MTEYEMADLFLDWGTYVEDIVQNFISLLFAFLIASYLVSHRLTQAMATLVLALFSWMALRAVLQHYNLSTDVIALANSIGEVNQEPGSALDWLIVGESVASIAYRTQEAAMILSYLAALVFFFYTRHHPR